MSDLVPPRDWAWDGGRLSLDFVNTLRDRKGEGRELLRGPADLAAWLTASGLTPGEPPVTDDLLAEARALREAVRGCADSVMAREPCAGPDIVLLNGWAARRRPPVVQLGQADGLPSLVVLPAPDPVAGALAEIAHDAVALLGGDERDQVRICASPTCGLRFADRSNAGRRLWCSMRRCGNREKARLHRARHRDT